MKLRSKTTILRRRTSNGGLSTDVCSCNGRSDILAIDGTESGSKEPVEAYDYVCEIVEATEEELKKLSEAGYASSYMKN